MIWLENISIVNCTGLFLYNFIKKSPNFMLPDVENRILKAARTDRVMFHVTKNNKKIDFCRLAREWVLPLSTSYILSIF